MGMGLGWDCGVVNNFDGGKGMRAITSQKCKNTSASGKLAGVCVCVCVSNHH